MEETTAIVKTRRIGGSLVVTIPSHIVKSEKINENNLLKIKVMKKRTSYLGALKGIGSYNREEDRAKGQLDED
jgi:antitoxin component of MazEF toxin-antitoxin module